MADKLDNLKKGVKFGEGQSIAGAGRPKKVLTKYKEMGYSKSQVRDTYAALAGMTKNELEVVVKDKEATALEVSISRAFLKAMAKGEYKFIKDIVELFADKASQSIGIDAKIENKQTNILFINEIKREDAKMLVELRDKYTGIE